MMGEKCKKRRMEEKEKKSFRFELFLRKLKKTKKIHFHAGRLNTE
jgi:hypothetical protein